MPSIMNSRNAICFRLILALLTAMIFACFTACSPDSATENPSDQKIILYAEFMHEVNSFSPVITTEKNFKADHLFYGDQVPASAIEEDKQLAGFLSAVDKSGRGRIKAIKTSKNI